MKRLLLPALLLTILTACTAAPAGTLPAAAPTPTPASTPAPTAAPAPADALTPEEKIGQLFIIRPDALDLTLSQETINDAKADGVTMLTDAMRETLQAYPVGGICQFGKNITDPEQLAQFNADLQAASRTPLFIAVDEEGGAVARLANHPAFDLPQYESAAAVGASGDPADACAMGQTIGAYLKEYGFNMDFAPDADVNTNPDNPIIGTRAFSSDAATAAEIIDISDEFGRENLERFGTRRFFCADELFLRAGRPLPEEDYYEGYRQLENGVGMLRSLGDDFLAALDTVDVPEEFSSFTIATGTAAAPFLTGLVQQAQARFPGLRGEVVAIDNDFFGHTIDVAGLLTGQDISAQLQKRPLGDRVLIPLHMLRHGETVFLDDYTVERLSQELGRPVQVVGLDGFDLADALFAPAESRQDNGRS